MRPASRGSGGGGRPCRYHDPVVSAEWEEADPLAPPANSPAAIVRAAKASLKEPSRPFTPSDGSRKLFALDDFGSSRPGSAYGRVPPSAFLEPDGPRAMPQMLPPMSPSSSISSASGCPGLPPLAVGRSGSNLSRPPSAGSMRRSNSASSSTSQGPPQILQLVADSPEEVLPQSGRPRQPQRPPSAVLRSSSLKSRLQAVEAAEMQAPAETPSPPRRPGLRRSYSFNKDHYNDAQPSSPHAPDIGAASFIVTPARPISVGSNGSSYRDVPLGLSDDGQSEDDGPLTGWGDTEAEEDIAEGENFTQGARLERPWSSRGREGPHLGGHWNTDIPIASGIDDGAISQGRTDPRSTTPAEVMTFGREEAEGDVPAVVASTCSEGHGVQHSQESEDDIPQGLPPPVQSAFDPLVDGAVHRSGSPFGDVAAGASSGEQAQLTDIVNKNSCRNQPERPRTPVHPAMASANGVKANGRPPTSRGRPGTARPGDVNRLDAPPIPSMRLSFDGAPTGTKTLRESVQVLEVTPRRAAGREDLHETDEFLAWRCTLERRLFDLSAALGQRDPDTGVLSGAASSQELGKELLRVKAAVHEGMKAMEWTAWLVGPSSTLTKPEDSSSPLPLRTVLLEHLACCVEASDPVVVLRAAALILRVANTSRARLSTCKVLYTLSKEKNNDALFRSEGLMAPLVELIQAANRRPADVGLDSLVYGLGALKNTTATDAASQRALVKAGGIQAGVQLLQTLVAVARKATAAAEEGKGGSKMSGIVNGAAQVAVQASGCLRNLAMSSSHMKLFHEAGIVAASASVLSVWSSHVEVALNVVRILAKLSLLPEFGAAMVEHVSFVPSVLELLHAHPEERAVVLRAAFVLGNLTTDSQEARERVAGCPRALPTLAALLQRYVGDEPSAPRSKAASARASREEVLVKLVRLLANLSLHPEFGPTIAREGGVARAMLALLQQHSVADAEELVLNVASLITNLSFYATDTNALLHGPDGCDTADFAKALLKHVTPLLLCENEEAVVEAARVYGNFSRIPEVREFMLETRVMEALTLLLDHPNMEVLYAVVGSLVNLTTDSLHRDALVEAGGCRGLLDVLERCVAAVHAAGSSPNSDGASSTATTTTLPLDATASLAVIVCKAMVNITVVGTGSTWDEEELDAACRMLDAVAEVRAAGLASVASELSTVLRRRSRRGEEENEDDDEEEGTVGGTYLEPL